MGYEPHRRVARTGVVRLDRGAGALASERGRRRRRRARARSGNLRGTRRRRGRVLRGHRERDRRRSDHGHPELRGRLHRRAGGRPGRGAALCVRLERRVDGRDAAPLSAGDHHPLGLGQGRGGHGGRTRAARADDEGDAGNPGAHLFGRGRLRRGRVARTDLRSRTRRSKARRGRRASTRSTCPAGRPARPRSGPPTCSTRR